MAKLRLCIYSTSFSVRIYYFCSCNASCNLLFILKNMGGQCPIIRILLEARRLLNAALLLGRQCYVCAQTQLQWPVDLGVLRGNVRLFPCLCHTRV